MMKVEKFEDLVVWGMTRAISRDVYKLTNTMSKRDYGFCDQIRRAAVSVMNNISEGYERGSNKDFVKFLFIARGSCGEVRSMLYVALDQQYIGEEEFDKLTGQCRQCSAAIWGLIRSLSKTSNWKERVEIGLMLLFPALMM
jgi:four helix bundle protein